MARRNRRVEPDGVRPSGPMAQRSAHWMADWRRRAGKQDGRNGPARSSAGFFVCFFSGGVGRGRRTSGVDGADIGRGTCRVKEYYRKKGNIVERPAGGARRMGCAGRQGWKGSQDRAARRAAIRRGIPRRGGFWLCIFRFAEQSSNREWPAFVQPPSPVFRTAMTQPVTPVPRICSPCSSASRSIRPSTASASSLAVRAPSS